MPYGRGVTHDDERPAAADALDRVTWALRRAEWAVQARKDQRLRPLGLAAAQYTLLISVHSDPGLTGAELARRLNVTPKQWPPRWAAWRSGVSWNADRTRVTAMCGSCTSPKPAATPCGMPTP